jgi:hypothetical protein
MAEGMAGLKVITIFEFKKVELTGRDSETDIVNIQHVRGVLIEDN